MESMTREIENLKMNLQLYDGHGLNLLTYDELLCFELHLESSLQHVRARKVNNTITKHTHSIVHTFILIVIKLLLL